MEWNGMEWNGMEWNGIGRYMNIYIRIVSKIRITENEPSGVLFFGLPISPYGKWIKTKNLAWIGDMIAQFLP